jgi:ankyrin repeat protein
LKLLRQGLNPNSRDLLGYSLLHASVLANSGRTIQTLLTAGAISQEAFCITEERTVTVESLVLSTTNRQQARIFF